MPNKEDYATITIWPVTITRWTTSAISWSIAALKTIANKRKTSIVPQNHIRPAQRTGKRGLFLIENKLGQNDARPVKIADLPSVAKRVTSSIREKKFGWKTTIRQRQCQSFELCGCKNPTCTGSRFTEP